jgi:flagellar biosynthesis regulator FlbT
MPRYDKDKIFEQAKEAIKKHELYFIEDIVAYLPLTKTTFYDYFKIGSDELNELKDLLDQNKVVTKVAIRKQLSRSEKAGELLALYRLICTKEEHMLLNQQYVDHTTDGRPFKINIIERA